MAALDDKTKQLLADVWLPQLRALREQRKPMVRIMQAVLLAPLIMTVLVGISLLINQDQVVFKTGICALMMGVSALALDYLGRMQKCNDIIAVIECLVYIGDRDDLIKSFSHISCLGKMQEIVRDTRTLLRVVQK